MANPAILQGEAQVRGRGSTERRCSQGKTARTEDDEDYVNKRSANIEDSFRMEGFAREGEGTDAALGRYFGINSTQR
jgi:hypothetical protein